jgi:hypothetical protein
MSNQFKFMNVFGELEDIESETNTKEAVEARPFVTTEQIAFIASRKHFSVEREQALIQRALTSKCRCKHWSNSNPCYYRNCRHTVQNHYGAGVLA